VGLIMFSNSKIDTIKAEKYQLMLEQNENDSPIDSLTVICSGAHVELAGLNIKVANFQFGLCDVS
jgi:hypothetical protein